MAPSEKRKNIEKDVYFERVCRGEGDRVRTTLEDRWRRRQKREEAGREIVSNLVAGAPDLSSATSDLCGIFVAQPSSW